MAYSIELTKDAQHDLTGLDQETARRIIQKLRRFASQDNPLRFAIPLRNPISGDIRFRIGDYRAIAIVAKDKRVITIVAIGHRREVYR